MFQHSQFAKLDLDLLQMKIYMEMKAYDAAQDMYLMGKNTRLVDGFLSFYFLATNDYREDVPQYSDFKQYFGDDYDYADTIVAAALAGVSPYNELSHEQRVSIVVKTLQYVVMYMAASGSMYGAVTECIMRHQPPQRGSRPQPDSQQPNSPPPPNTGQRPRDRLRLSYDPWDIAAANLIGSLEGPDDNGNPSDPGYFFFGLGQLRCEEFGTCDKDGNAEVNKALITLLYAGQSQLDSGNCDALKQTTEKIVDLLHVPLIQSTLSYAVANDGLVVGTQEASFAIGSIFARSILPVINKVDTSAARVIERNMELQFERRPVFQGFASVFEAFKDATPKLIGLNCEDVGRLNEMDVCGTPFILSIEKSLNRRSVLAIVIGANVVLLVLAFFIGFRCNRRLKFRQEKIVITDDRIEQGEADTANGGSETTESFSTKGKTEVLDHMGVVD